MFRKLRSFLIRKGVLKPLPFDKQVKNKMKSSGRARYVVEEEGVDNLVNILETIEGIEWRVIDSQLFLGKEIHIWKKEDNQ